MDEVRPMADEKAAGDGNELVRITLERAATRLERAPGNRVYKSAFRTAAKLIREMKPGT
jgi:hypothetical protein